MRLYSVGCLGNFSWTSVPGEVLPYINYIGSAAVKGMVFKQFTLGLGVYKSYRLGLK